MSLYKSFKKPINPCFAIKAPRSWKRKEAVDEPLQGIDTAMQFSTDMSSCLTNILKYHRTTLELNRHYALGSAFKCGEIIKDSTFSIVQDCKLHPLESISCSAKNW